MADQPVMQIDTKGLCCPMPILKAKKAIDSIAVGEVIEVLATDPGSKADFESWTRTTGHELVSSGENGGVFTYQIRKTR